MQPTSAAYSVCNKLLDNYTSARQQHKDKNVIWAAMDSAASDHYFPSWFRGDNHDPKKSDSPVGTTSRNIMKSVAADRLDIPVLTSDTPVLAPAA